MNKTKIDKFGEICEKVISWYFIIQGTILIILGSVGYKFYSIPFDLTAMLIAIGLVNVFFGLLISLGVRINALEEKTKCLT